MFWQVRYWTKRVLKPLLATVLTIAWLISSFAAINPALHADLHHSPDSSKDESSPPSSGQHQCAATLLAKGTVDISDSSCDWIGLLLAERTDPSAIPELFLPQIPYRLLPGRAPPAL